MRVGDLSRPGPSLAISELIISCAPQPGPPTTNIYNDYIDSLPLHAKGGGCVVGLTYSDNALFGKDDSSAVPMGGSLRSHTDRIAFLVPGDACRRGTAFGYEPGR